MGKLFGIAACLAIIAGAVAIAIWGTAAHEAVKTVDEILGQNKRLEAALTNLKRESRIGYARVIEQTRQDGKVITRLKFVQTHRDDPTQQIQEREYRIEGDVVYFDALVVAFAPEMVQDGRARSLYLWRRVYGEYQTPSQAFPIEEPGQEPARYDDLLEQLPVEEQTVFWDAIWGLAHDPERLSAHGIRATYGSAVYQRLRPGFIYIFKISDTGQVYPETVPAI
ncbi:MAG: hypothetical protein ACFB20_04850 [Opitutales bacterium]